MNHGGPRYARRGHPNNRGRSPRSADNSTYRPRHAGGEEPSVAGSSNPSSGAFRGRISHQMTPRNLRNQFVQKQASSSEQLQWRPVNSKKDASPGAVDLQQEHSSADDMSNTSKQLLGSIASNSDSNHTSNISSAQNVSKSLHSAVEKIQIREPIAEGGSCSDSLPYDNCNRSAVEQGLVVQVPLESCAKDESSTIKSRENNVSDCKDSEDKKPSVTLDPFDICPPKSGVVTLEPSLLANNREPIAEGGSCSDSLPYDNCNKSAVEQGLMVQVPLESSAKDESSTIKSRENNVSDCKDSEDKKPSVNLDPFDIRPPKSGVVTLKPSLLANNREPIADGGSCSDSLPCNKSAVEQRLVVQVPLESCAKDESSTIKSRENNVSDCKDSEDKKPSVNLDPFDICPPKSGVVTLNPSLFANNREKRNEMKRAKEGNSGIVLRPGMVHLKSCISLRDQVNIVKICRELGIRAGGFYQPGYREGGKLHLKMMCLGKNWDPDSSTYGDVRPFDDTKPPGIPDEFYQLVEKAIQDSYAIMMKDSTAKNPERVLPWMKPNICIVNFYSQNGRLGLHQDRDESPESLDKGLPVVSFSIGDSADFLFGDRNDADQAEKVTLKSGDILIFGGKSRHVFHGVTAIHPNTAPGALLDQTNLRSGRLNLTFRQN